MDEGDGPNRPKLPLTDIQLGGGYGKGEQGTQKKALRKSVSPGCGGFAPTANRTPSSGGLSVRAHGGARTEDCPPAPREPGTAGGGELPCLSSNNSTEPGEEKHRLLSAQHRKSASALAWNVQHLAEKFGIETLGFLTLTFADHVLDGREAQRRFNSLATHVLRSRYRAHIRVIERQKSGRIHYHLIVALSSDIRTGADFDAFARGDYRSASPALRSEWSFWRSTAREYGFGRTELLPVKSTHEGIARYVGKYISKHIGNREERDKGLRLVEYSRSARMANTRFAWATAGAAEWRAKVRTFASMLSVARRAPLHDLSDITRLLGPRWAYHHRDFIASLPPTESPHGN